MQLNLVGIITIISMMVYFIGIAKRQDINTPTIQEIVNANLDVHLTCRITTQNDQGKTNPFVYCGELLYNDHVPGTANPIHMSFTCLDLVGDQPENIEVLSSGGPLIHNHYKILYKHKERVSHRVIQMIQSIKRLSKNVPWML